MEFTQSDFRGGINQLDDDTGIKDNEYVLLVNGRQRYGQVQPNRASTEQRLPFAGNPQALMSVGNTLLLIISGRAYYRIYGQSTWIRIADFSMDATAERVWLIAIPKSSRDYVRKLNVSLNNPIIINTDFNISGTPAGIIVQDGINQPWLIQFNAVTQTFVARVTKTYAQWANSSVTANDREYVPIGKQMFMLNEKLFVLAPDSKSIYQSVTGRPLDFMVNVDADGNKLVAESEGGASSVSFAFDNDDITCIRDVNITNTFLYGTARHVRLITLDYTQTIFGEPYPIQAQKIEAGILNDQCFVDALGDYTFIDNDGIKSFNAVQNLRVEGRNSVFSQQIDRLIAGRVQESDTAAAYAFNNYGLYYCKTLHGRAIAVYDMLHQVWVSLDITNVQNVKQFCALENGAISVLYAITDDAVWEMYTADTREMGQLHIKALMPGDIKNEHKGHWVKPIFRGATIDGVVEVQEKADDQQSQRETRDTENSVMAMTWPLFFPITFSSKPNAYNNVIVVDKGLAGKKLAYVILWNTDASLMNIGINTSEQEAVAATRQTGTN